MKQLQEKPLGKTRSGLTDKQRMFARCVASGLSQADAYREAYDTQAQGNTIRTKASTLMARGDIRAMVERLREQREQAIVRAGVSDKERVLKKLRELVDSGSTEASMLKACDLLGRSVGLYRDVQETVESRSSDDVAAELEARIAALIDGDMSDSTTH